VLLHLSVNEPGNLALVDLKDLSGIVFRKISQKVANGLGGEIVEQIGLMIVGNIVEIDEAGNDVVFDAAFGDVSILSTL
jgi:hypothetical protein